MNWDDMLIALGERNGSNGASDNGIEELQTAFEGQGYIFRHFPNAACGPLHWQALRSELTEVQIGEDLFLMEVFHLVEWAATSQQLVEKLIAR